MKVAHTQLVAFCSGKSDGTVLCAAPSKTFSLARRYVYPTITTANHTKGTEMSNLAVMYGNVHGGFLQDLKDYARRYYSENLNQPDLKIPSPNPFAHFLKMCFAWYESDIEHVNLSTCTVADAVALNADIQQIKMAIDAGFLPPVQNYSEFTQPIQVTP